MRRPALHIEKAADIVRLADAAAKQKLRHDIRNAGGPTQRGHARRIVTRNAPALGHNVRVP
jgi:hypothetical protein